MEKVLLFGVPLGRYIRFLKHCCLIYEVVCGVQPHSNSYLTTVVTPERCVFPQHITHYFNRFVMVSTEQTTPLCEGTGVEVLWLPTAKKKINVTGALTECVECG
jgi:hypothetical protein